ncbi:MAG: hypothetical protein JOZ69_21955, partial [Myxococcales bacterium]|nr:hypothetical protein [Myxococcales bacterium]
MSRRTLRPMAALFFLSFLWVAGCADIWGFRDLPSGAGSDAGIASTMTGDATVDGAHRDSGRDGGDGEAGPTCHTTVCGGVCVDPMTDPKNCGGCGTVCPAGAPCQGGQCLCAGNET